MRCGPNERILKKIKRMVRVGWWIVEWKLVERLNGGGEQFLGGSARPPASPCQIAQRELWENCGSL